MYSDMIFCAFVSGVLVLFMIMHWICSSLRANVTTPTLPSLGNLNCYLDSVLNCRGGRDRDGRIAPPPTFLFAAVKRWQLVQKTPKSPPRLC